MLVAPVPDTLEIPVVPDTFASPDVQFPVNANTIWDIYSSLADTVEEPIGELLIEI